MTHDPKQSTKPLVSTPLLFPLYPDSKSNGNTCFSIPTKLDAESAEVLTSVPSSWQYLPSRMLGSNALHRQVYSHSAKYLFFTTTNIASTVDALSLCENTPMDHILCDHSTASPPNPMFKYSLLFTATKRRCFRKR